MNKCRRIGNNGKSKEESTSEIDSEMRQKLYKNGMQSQQDVQQIFFCFSCA